jgi:hypothetical protein
VKASDGAFEKREKESTMAIQDTDLMDLTMNQYDSLWDRLKANVDGLKYTEAELVANPELFVFIAQKNAVLNFRDIVISRTLKVPKRSILADVVTAVKADSATYGQKWYETVQMDRCVGNR